MISLRIPKHLSQLRHDIYLHNIGPMQKGASLFLSYTNTNKIDSLHHVKEHPIISNFLQFESHSSKCVKVRAISDLRDLYGDKIQGLTATTGSPNFSNMISGL